MNHRKRKQAIRSFMQNHYTDERLAQLLAHAQSGKLMYTNCCCFIGCANADHALRTGHNLTFFHELYGSVDPAVAHSRNPAPYDNVIRHYEMAQRLSGADEAEAAYRELGLSESTSINDVNDAVRRRLLIPMIRAEQKRREARRAEFQETSQEVFA